MGARLLIAYDGSAAAEAAVAMAGRLFAGATGRLLNVVEVPPRVAEVQALGFPFDRVTLQRGIDELTRELRDAGREIADHGVAAGERAGLGLEPVAAARRTGTWEDILAAADELDADVIVCGSRGRGGVARSLLGSTSTSLLHHARRPVLVVPAEPATVDGPAVIAYDRSPGARAAVAAAGRLLGGRAAVVTYVWYSSIRHSLAGRAVASGPIGDLREFAADWERFFADAAKEVADEGAALARDAGLDASAVAIESDEGAWRAVAQAASERGAAVIVTGSRGRRGLSAAVLGSFSSGLVHNAELPVLVVRPDEDAAD